MYIAFLKRPIDLLASLFLFIFLSPLFLIIAIILAITLKGSPFFVQRRPGRNEKIFSIIKFKSMNNNTDEHGELLPNEQRITTLGRIIRKSSLDEIPQLINVIKGDMSFVGPRPLKVDYLALYNPEQSARHSVRPGITGWAQVNGRNAISHTEKFKYDVWYVNHYNFFLDMKILVLTLLKVLKRDGVSQTGGNPNAPFNGSN